MTWKQKAVAVGFGIGGVLIGLGGWHAWQDHANLHGIINMIVAQQQQAARSQAQIPQPPK